VRDDDEAAVACDRGGVWRELQLEAAALDELVVASGGVEDGDRAVLRGSGDGGQAKRGVCRGGGDRSQGHGQDDPGEPAHRCQGRSSGWWLARVEGGCAAGRRWLGVLLRMLGGGVRVGHGLLLIEGTVPS
jgi:hypothetical protein